MKKQQQDDPESMRGRSRGWWLNRIAIVFIAVGVVVAGYFVYYNTFGYWHRLERAASKIETPPNTQRLFHARVGTFLCFVTCNSRDATVEVVYITRLSKDEACTAFRTEIDKSLETRADPEHGSGLCSYFAYIPSVKSDARAWVDYLTMGEFHNPSYELEWSERVRELRAGEAVVILALNSGIE